MKRPLFLLITFLPIFSISVTNAGEKRYPWNLFRGVLSNDNCDSSNPSLCRNKAKCEALNCFFYDNQCNKNKHPNQIKQNSSLVSGVLMIHQAKLFTTILKRSRYRNRNREYILFKEAETGYLSVRIKKIQLIIHTAQ